MVGAYLEEAGWSDVVAENRTPSAGRWGRTDPLYAVIGTTYGGDGLKTFALPNFNGRVAVNAGQGPNCSSY
ncbi:MAG: hypothetical protein EOO39_50450 [Cytophagaceae bacterium]|nr:MAG: hypothetical protein EOO39_50450 [Cytophagaceae bacterium]